MRVTSTEEGTSQYKSNHSVLPKPSFNCTASRSTDCLDLEDDLSCYPGSKTAVEPAVVTVVSPPQPSMTILSPSTAVVSPVYLSPPDLIKSPLSAGFNHNLSSRLNLTDCRHLSRRQGRTSLDTRFTESKIVLGGLTPPAAVAASVTPKSYSRRSSLVNHNNGSAAGNYTLSPRRGDLSRGGSPLSSRHNTPAGGRNGRERMRKYHAVIRLNNSVTSSSDMSTLDLSTLDSGLVDSGGRGGGEGVENVNPAALYYTIDSRRLASKHKKSLRER